MADRHTTAITAAYPNCEQQIHCRLLLQPVGIPIYNFASIRELLSALIDIIDVHHALMERFNILHHDISINNIMLYICDSPESNGQNESDSEGEQHGGTGTSGDRAGEGMQPDEIAMQNEETREKLIHEKALQSGLLINFDYATLLEENTGAGPGNRTGTILFMLINILHGYKTPHVHTPADDLESLIYVLVWVCVLYAGPSGQLHRDKELTETALKHWVMVNNESDAMALAMEKIGQATEPNIVTNDFTPYFDCLKPIHWGTDYCNRKWGRNTNSPLMPQWTMKRMVIGMFLQSTTAWTASTTMSRIDQRKRSVQAEDTFPEVVGIDPRKRARTALGGKQRERWPGYPASKYRTHPDGTVDCF
ncbi:hypothetical protein PAXINDRAFT_155187 [Paxillus involutus ATCC 200175]|nr:hypothetical protein PAXINDRAFT_155187 [Paxillus involutus ATCC 200175]